MKKREKTAKTSQQGKKWKRAPRVSRRSFQTPRVSFLFTDSDLSARVIPWAFRPRGPPWGLASLLRFTFETEKWWKM